MNKIVVYRDPDFLTLGALEQAQQAAGEARDAAAQAAAEAAAAVAPQVVIATDAASDAVQARADAQGAQGLAESARDDALDAKGLAEAARDDAVIAEGAASGHAANAQLAQSAAEAARDAATVNAQVYADTAAGLAATTEGDQFQVVSGDEIIRYRHDAGPVATEVARYPSAEKVAPIVAEAPLGYDWSILDADGNAAIGVREDGSFRAAQVVANEVALGDGAFDDTPSPGYVFTIRDDDDRFALGVLADGTLEVAKIIDRSAADVSEVDRHGGVYTAELNFIATQGQSLAGGSDGAVTTTQEYDNICFRAHSVNPTAVYPLTTADGSTTQGGGNTENPAFGTAGFIKELIKTENGLDYQANKYQLLSACNGSSGAPIDGINKGGSSGAYEAAISQVAAGKALADSSGRTFAFQAVTWTQGESDTSMAKDTYKAKLIQLAKDFNADGKAITGQTRDVAFICYQLCRTAALNTVTPALLEASEDVAHIHLATPTYFMDFYDGTHLKAQSSKWLGGYYGLVYKRVMIDGKDWQPLKPVQHAVIGNTVDLYFNKQGLVFDTAMMPAQANYGFTAEDASGTSVAISSVEIVRPNRVRIAFAGAPATGWRIKYGHISVAGKTNYSGPGGNLRDSAGDAIVYGAINKPMHNWCVIFDYMI